MIILLCFPRGPPFPIDKPTAITGVNIIIIIHSLESKGKTATRRPISHPSTPLLLIHNLRAGLLTRRRAPYQPGPNPLGHQHLTPFTTRPRRRTIRYHPFHRSFTQGVLSWISGTLFPSRYPLLPLVSPLLDPITRSLPQRVRVTPDPIHPDL